MRRARAGGAGGPSGRVTRPTGSARARSSSRRRTVPCGAASRRAADSDPERCRTAARRVSVLPLSSAHCGRTPRSWSAAPRPAGRRSPARSGAGARPRGPGRAAAFPSRADGGAGRAGPFPQRTAARSEGPSSVGGAEHRPRSSSPSATARLTPAVPPTSSRTRRAGAPRRAGEQRRDARLAAGSIEPMRSSPLRPSRSSAMLRESESTASRIGSARAAKRSPAGVLGRRRPPVEELESELRLELLDVQRHGRLRQAQSARGPAESFPRAGPRGRSEGGEGPWRHSVFLILISHYKFIIDNIIYRLRYRGAGANHALDPSPRPSPRASGHAPPARLRRGRRRHAGPGDRGQHRDLHRRPRRAPARPPLRATPNGWSRSTPGARQRPPTLLDRRLSGPACRPRAAWMLSSRGAAGAPT